MALRFKTQQFKLNISQNKKNIWENVTIFHKIQQNLECCVIWNVVVLWPSGPESYHDLIHFTFCCGDCGLNWRNMMFKLFLMVLLVCQMSSCLKWERGCFHAVLHSSIHEDNFVTQSGSDCLARSLFWQLFSCEHMCNAVEAEWSTFMVSEPLEENTC